MDILLIIVCCMIYAGVAIWMVKECYGVEELESFAYVIGVLWPIVLLIATYGFISNRIKWWWVARRVK